MADSDRLPHIKLNGFSSTRTYTSPKSGGGRAAIAQRNRNIHGNHIMAHLESISAKYEELQKQDLSSDLVKEDAIYVEFISDYNIELAFDSFEDNRGHGKYHLLSVKKEIVENGDIEAERYRALVMLTSKGISAFIQKVENYLDPNRDLNIDNPDKRKPSNQKLIANISDIKIATLRAFWTESEYPFPNEDESTWWEVWLRKSHLDQGLAGETKVIQQLEAIDAHVGSERLIFPEHVIRLVKATPHQLSKSLMFLDNLAELRKPKDTAEFFTRMSSLEEQEWIDELKERIKPKHNQDSIAICLLDTGVNNGHPLLVDFLPDENMDAYKKAWENGDSYPSGHGTQMAGLALYGDMTELFARSSQIEIFHQLESVKILQVRNPHDPKLYGAVTEESVSRPEVTHPSRKRLFCMAITSDDGELNGRPSSWSASMDRITGGFSDGQQKLIFVSGGNVVIEKPEDYPDKNHLSPIHDPGQAFNAVTVGSYTVKEWVDPKLYPGTSPLAKAGAMSPSNSTSMTWSRRWPAKPDIVMEGGNLAVQKGTIIEPDALSLLSTNNQFRIRQLAAFGDTSGATALASKMAAEIYTEYPDFWPETIRGLMAHSADWTTAMLENKALDELKQTEKANVLKCYGYGVPNKERALHSLKNSVTLLAERSIQPFIKSGNDIKTNEIHFFELPWPADVLAELGTEEIMLRATLSYFIEPNPGNRSYANNFHYRSHALSFRMNHPLEGIEEFSKRINKADREPDEKLDSNAENWLIGINTRSKGSLVKDRWKGTAADLSTKNLLAVYPGNGWYRTRKKLQKYGEKVRYSLIVSIDAPETDMDIYTPVANLIGIEI
ncbi:MAG: S8 family peptidase [Bacteroidetes bacterium]|nr:S8 family peptidase [Bacteroidota bacterium]